MLFLIKQNTLFLTNNISASRGVLDSDDIEDVSDERMQELCEKYPDDIVEFDQKKDKTIPPLSIIMENFKDPETKQLNHKEIKNNVELEYETKKKKGNKDDDEKTNNEGGENQTQQNPDEQGGDQNDQAGSGTEDGKGEPSHPMAYDDITLPEMKAYLNEKEVAFSHLEDAVVNKKDKFYPFYKENCA